MNLLMRDLAGQVLSLETVLNDCNKRLTELRLFQFEDLQLVNSLLEICAELLVFGIELLLAHQHLLFSFFLFLALEFQLLLKNDQILFQLFVSHF